MAQISREQLEQLRAKGLRPKTQEDMMREALQSPLEKLKEQHKSLTATATQIQNTYAEKWFNAQIQFAFKLVEQMNLDLSIEKTEQDIKELQISCTNAVAAAEILTEQLRRRENDYKSYIAKDAPVPETLIAGIQMIEQEIKQKYEAKAATANMTLEKIDNEANVESGENNLL